MSGSCTVENQVIFPHESHTQTCLLIGSILSFVSCGILIVAYIAFSSLRRQPNDLCFVAFVWHTYFDDNTDEDCRSGFSFMIAATLAGSEICFVCLTYDLYLNLRSPFSSFKNGNMIYAAVVTLGALLCGLIVTGMNGDSAGLWLTGFCLTNYCRNKDLNLNWGFGTLTPICVGLVGAIFVIVYTRLTLTGWSDERVKIWKPRNRMIKLMEEYTAVYAIYWFITLICVYFPIWIFVSIEDNDVDTDPTDNVNSRRLMSVFLLFLSAKGVPTTIVWMKAWFKQWSENYFKVYGVRGMVGIRGIANVANAFKFTDKALAPDMNAALRTELVQYLTFGIQALSNMDENSIQLRPARFNRKSGWLQRMLHGQQMSYDSVTTSLVENDQCVKPTSPPSKSEDDDGFVKLNMPTIKKQDSTAFVLTEAKGDEPFTATVENLFDEHFRRIRNSLFSTTEYNASLRQINPGKETQGRSGAFLFKTRDQRLILKTVTKTELEVLRSLLEDRILNSSKKQVSESPSTTTTQSNAASMTYTEYMENYGHESLIMKIVGCFRLTLHEYGNESKVFIVCMNVLPNNKTITVDELYDLKGSIMSRNVTRPSEGSEAFCKYCHKNYIVCDRQKLEKMRTHRRGSTSMLSNNVSTNDVRVETKDELVDDDDDESDDDMYSQYCPSSSRYHEPVMLFKDNDLKRKITLPSKEVNGLKSRICRDVKWFLAHRIMDYSLLLGVVWGSYRVEGKSEEEKDDKDEEEKEEEKKEEEEDSPLPPVVPIFTTRDESRRHMITNTNSIPMLPSTDKRQSLHCYEARVVEAPKSYYMGIIDILQRFDWSKRAEYYIKTGILKKDWHTISCAEPKFYAKRFLNFMDAIIVDDMQRTALQQKLNNSTSSS